MKETGFGRGRIVGLAARRGIRSGNLCRRSLKVHRGDLHSLAKFADHVQPEECTTQVLRHTFDKNLADAGTPIQVIADLMGHESLETSRWYIQREAGSP